MDTFIIEQLVSESVQGNKTALNRLVITIQDDIFNLALRMLGKPEDARDCTQEILLKIVTHLGGFRGESGFRTWYYRIACNYLLNYRENLQNQQMLSFNDLGPMLESNLSERNFQDEEERQSLAEKVKTACTMGMLQCLTKEARIVYILGEILQFNSVAGSKMLNITEDNYRQLLSRSRKKITVFTQRYCGIINAAAKCSCAKAVNRAIESGLVDANNSLMQKLDVLVDKRNGLFPNLPVFQTPEKVWLEIEETLNL